MEEDKIDSQKRLLQNLEERKRKRDLGKDDATWQQIDKKKLKQPETTDTPLVRIVDKAKPTKKSKAKSMAKT